jgi:large subunit ribosomal protein L33
MRGFLFVRFFNAGAENPASPIQGGNARPVSGRVNKIGGAERMAAGARVKITLRCDECKQRNYNTVKNKKNTSDRLERSKYCPFCRKHTKHVESK